MSTLGEGKEKHRLASEIHVQWVKFRSSKAVALRKYTEYLWLTR